MLNKYCNSGKHLLLLGFMLVAFVMTHAQTSAKAKSADIAKTVTTHRDPCLLDSFLTKHSIDLNCISNPGLYSEVYQWYSTRYHWGGASKTGVDCAGFVFRLFSSIYGIDLPRSATLIFPLCRPLDECEEPEEGDLVFFNIKGRWLSHIGIYLQDGLFVHASVHSGVVISSLNEPYYKKYFYRFAKLTAPSAMIGDGL